jgi:hypothetical protein
MQIRELLNPISSGEGIRTPSRQMQVPSQPTPGQSRPKQRKDEPALRLQAARGVNFPPLDRIEDPEILGELQRWSIWPPLSEIARYCDRIPYHSEKKNFGNLTGRDAFEGLSAHILMAMANSISVRLPLRVPRRCSPPRKRPLLGHMGLPSRPRPHNPILQSARLPKSTSSPVPAPI